jgi:integrase/recombinase XerD
VWDAYLKGFKAYLQLERSMSDNTVEAYLHDVAMLGAHIRNGHEGLGIEHIQLTHLRSFLGHINELELAAGTQARILSGIKSFFGYLLLEEIIKTDPTQLLEAPKLKRTLPVVLSIQEIDLLFAAIDHSTPEGQRNRAMLETMYSCGLRVSELTHLCISNLYLEVGFVRVVGKGNKERLIPIGSNAVEQINLYRQHTRAQVPHIKQGSEDILFLNRRGGGLSRVMVFMILKDLAVKAGLKQGVHPHTLRHSFATHLVEAGADLRSVQEMMGHKSITTTEIYTHLDRSYLRKTLEQFHPRFGK